eukprot:8742238-Alexandrium_andersonii.AAC.1
MQTASSAWRSFTPSLALTLPVCGARSHACALLSVSSSASGWQTLGGARVFTLAPPSFTRTGHVCCRSAILSGMLGSEARGRRWSWSGRSTARPSAITCL